MSKKYYKFVDNVPLTYKAGPGGDGSAARTRLRNHWMNIGGNGGNGGDIWIEADSNLFDLSLFSANKVIKSEKGQNGAAHGKKGAAGKDTLIKVPVGTFIRDYNGNVLIDLNKHGTKYLLAKGGQGGYGNYKREAIIQSKVGESGFIQLDYRLLVDVVMVGAPNTGKSAFLSYCTKREFKVAHYPYATYHPMWGSCDIDWRSFTLMELPALVGKEVEVEPAYRYIRQMYRAKLILYFLDVEIDNFDEIVATLKETIRIKDRELLSKKSIIIANKCDIRMIDKNEVRNISVETGEGLDELLKEIEREIF